MKTIKRLFREVEIEILKVAFLNSFLNTCMVFFGTYLLMILFDINFIYAVLFAGLFFIGNFVYWKNRLNLKAVEDANPVVKEMLRTAHDNQDEKNVLVLGLFYDVVKGMKKVSSGNLMDSNVLFKKVVAITVLTFAVVFISSLEIYLGNIAIPVDKIGSGIGGIFGGEGTPGQTNESIEALGFNTTPDLYGEESLAQLGKDELSLNINPSISELDFDQEKGLEDLEFSSDQFPEEVSAQSSEFGGNDIPEEAELAKEYNLKLKR